MELKTLEYWVKKLNNECESKNKQFGMTEWKLRDIDFDPEHDNPKDYIRGYCYQSYKTFELCYNCGENRDRYIETRMMPTKTKRMMETIEYMDKFLRQKFPDEYNPPQE